MGGLKGGEGELAADGGGAGPLGVSHSAELERIIFIFLLVSWKNYFQSQSAKLEKIDFFLLYLYHLHSAIVQSWKELF